MNASSIFSEFLLGYGFHWIDKRRDTLLTRLSPQLEENSTEDNKSLPQELEGTNYFLQYISTPR